MSTHQRFDKAFKNAKIVEFDDTSKYILFSDCHRGDNSFADDFANNRNTYFHALKQYYNEGFTYCELGDGNELWENLHFNSLFESHKNVFLLLKHFHDANRLYLLYGNHDMVYQDKKTIKKHYDTWLDPNLGEKVPFMPGLEYHEAIILQHKKTKQQIFLAHGHQADWRNHTFWRWNRFMVRVLWRSLQVVGISDPTSPAKNNTELIKIERRTKKWIADRKNQFTITGHTHRPRFPEPKDIAYFNDGSCVHPRSITGIEIQNGEIALIKWYVDTTDDGFLQIVRAVLEGPKKIIDYKTT
ncbi:serine/threonine protein phosphatase [Galbibacter pacificus]|uniref:Serine/threonine protein phosphatase n=1 Tax=Galbibacter pacificus TaxID=2996052 RepID=A0ABT6FWF8_9FLAO|nr:serine/threonine protein phosphatase [Galbibacter pacificus]MDG3583963.1 serine/threonine protein phosphatase [Galbibacter pacificus]MDG3587600.1 serine/threonine protein phosphatase [Galbibacter pacificus]